MKKIIIVLMLVCIFASSTFALEGIEKKPIILKDSENNLVTEAIHYSGDVYVPIGKMYLLKDVNFTYDFSSQEVRFFQKEDVILSSSSDRVLLPSGDIYIGEISYGKFNGRGTMYYLDGKKYDGWWKKGKKHGTGREYYLDGSYYNGKWSEGFIHGTGVYVYANGDVYSGNFEYGFRSGDGKMIYKNTFIYDGNWENGMYNGKGILYEGSTFTRGLWKNGKLDRALSRYEYDEME